MRLVLSALILLPLLVGPAASQAAEPGLHSFTLDNGLMVVVIEDHRAPGSASCYLNMAHLAEHKKETLRKIDQAA